MLGQHFAEKIHSQSSSLQAYTLEPLRDDIWAFVIDRLEYFDVAEFTGGLTVRAWCGLVAAGPANDGFVEFSVPRIPGNSTESKARLKLICVFELVSSLDM